MTFTFKLVRDIIKVNMCTDFQVRRSNGLVARVHADTHTQTDGRTDRTENITSSANAGGKMVFVFYDFGLLLVFFYFEPAQM